MRRPWLGVLLAVATGCGGGVADAARPAQAPASESVASPSPAPPPPAATPATLDVREEAKKEPDAAMVGARDKTRTLPAGAPGGGSVGSAPPATSNGPHETAMLIYTAHLTLAVFQVDQGLGAVEALARSLGGYLASRSDRDITIRVPRARFEEALSRIEKQGDVLHREVSAQDVTDEYVDLDVRLKNARAMRDRLQQLLVSASVKDAIEIEKELGRVTEQIERMEGRLKLLADQISYSTVTVSFQPIDQNPVHDLARLPFPWLRDLGLSQLLNVHE